jgi:HlyD family secretion protein
METMKKKIIISSAIIIIAVIAFFFFFFSKKEKINSLHTTGIVEGVEVNISSKVAGRISELCCKEGDAVKEGAVVVRLESDDITASVRQAKAGVERAKADIMVAESQVENSKANLKNAEAEIVYIEAELEKAKTQLEEARRQKDRADSLHKDGYISKAELDLAVTNYDTALANYEAAKARLTAYVSRRDAAASQVAASESQLSSARAGLKEAGAALSYQMARLNDTVIKTPISGAVVFKALEKGETVSPGIVILTIVDLNNLWIRIDLEETIIGLIKLGGDVLIRIEGIKGTIIKGKVLEIGRYAEFATQKDVTRGRQDIKTFRVRIKPEDISGILKPGMTVKVEVPIKG